MQEVKALLQVLREHRETLISVMETFVHDPLCEWTKRQQRSSVEEIDNPQAKDALATVEGAAQLTGGLVLKHLPAKAHAKFLSSAQRTAEAPWNGSSSFVLVLTCMHALTGMIWQRGLQCNARISLFLWHKQQLRVHFVVVPGRLTGTLMGVRSIPCLPLSAEGQAHRLIAEATDKENLGSMYIWWMPWF